jgi:hypothetical protein
MSPDTVVWPTNAVTDVETPVMVRRHGTSIADSGTTHLRGIAREMHVAAEFPFDATTPVGSTGLPSVSNRTIGYSRMPNRAPNWPQGCNGEMRTIISSGPEGTATVVYRNRRDERCFAADPPRVPGVW